MRRQACMCVQTCMCVQNIILQYIREYERIFIRNHSK